MRKEVIKTTDILRERDPRLGLEVQRTKVCGVRDVAWSTILTTALFGFTIPCRGTGCDLVRSGARIHKALEWECWSRICPCNLIHYELKGQTEPRSALVLWDTLDMGSEPIKDEESPNGKTTVLSSGHWNSTLSINTSRYVTDTQDLPVSPKGMLLYPCPVGTSFLNRWISQPDITSLSGQ